jgi:hypothetical protein
VLYDGSPEGLEILTILVDHGANLTLRDSNGGPVGWYNWRAVWLLMERGAAWQDELALGQPRSRYASPYRMGIPEEMGQILAMYGEMRGR